MRKWWADSVECYLRNVQDFMAEGKTPYESAIQGSIQRSNSSFWSNGWILFDFCTRPVQSRLYKFGKKVLHLEYALDMRWSRGEIWKGDILVADIEELEKMDASENYPRRINAKEASTSHKGEHFHIPNCRWCSKIVGKNMHSKSQLQESEDLSGELQSEPDGFSTYRIQRWRWSLERHLVYTRWLQLSSSQWTSSSTLCAERRNIPHSTDMHWCNKVCSHKSGRVAGKSERWFLECGRE